jgi:hypothetical protein
VPTTVGRSIVAVRNAAITKEKNMSPLSQLALAGGLAWGSGIRLYATIFIVGMLGRYGYLHLPAQLLVLQHPWVLSTAGILVVGEFLADKIPGFDSAWDGLHTFIRIPAGAFLAWVPWATRRPPRRWWRRSPAA